MIVKSSGLFEMLFSILVRGNSSLAVHDRVPCEGKETEKPKISLNFQFIWKSNENILEDTVGLIIFHFQVFLRYILPRVKIINEN